MTLTTTMTDHSGFNGSFNTYSSEQYQEHIVSLIESDFERLAVLKAVKSLDLPDCLVAAGFVRTLIWNSLYGTCIALQDVDVVYYSDTECSEDCDHCFEEELGALLPDVPWSVKNQARMHEKAGNKPYKSTLDAMTHWPEKQTAVGVAMDGEHHITVKHCFDLRLLFTGEISYNPKASLEAFNARVKSKQWLKHWPQLKIVVV